MHRIISSASVVVAILLAGIGIYPVQAQVIGGVGGGGSLVVTGQTASVDLILSGDVTGTFSGHDHSGNVTAITSLAADSVDDGALDAGAVRDELEAALRLALMQGNVTWNQMPLDQAGDASFALSSGTAWEDGVILTIGDVAGADTDATPVTIALDGANDEIRLTALDVVVAAGSLTVGGVSPVYVGTSASGHLSGSFPSPTVDWENAASLESDGSLSAATVGAPQIVDGSVGISDVDASAFDARYLDGGTLVDADEQLVFGFGSTGEISGDAGVSPIQTRSWAFDPDGVCNYTIDRYPLMYVGDDAPNGIVITEWKLSFDRDPVTEADLDLKYADAFIGVANSVTVDALDTTTGVSAEDVNVNINGGNAVPNGKFLYLEFGSEYLDPGYKAVFQIWWYAP